MIYSKNLITKTLMSFSIAILFLNFYSCKKCMTCVSTVTSSGAVDYTYPESCGRKQTLDVQELSYRANLEDSLTLKCTRD
jgi:hypothetical protein